MCGVEPIRHLPHNAFSNMSKEDIDIDIYAYEAKSECLTELKA